MSARIAIIASFVILAVGGLVLFTAAPRPQSGNAVSSTGDALIGGPFTMVDHNGTEVTDADYAGSALLVYFGFTFCPDVCPTELSKISQALDSVSAKTKAKIQPLFVTVDPQRDTPEQLKLYMSNFDPAIIGLTGTQAQVKDMLKTYRIFSAKVEDDASSYGYTFDHSSIIYLMSREGAYLAHFTKRDSANDIANRITALVK